MSENSNPYLIKDKSGAGEALKPEYSKKLGSKSFLITTLL